MFVGISYAVCGIFRCLLFFLWGNVSKGKKFYEMRMAGLENWQVAAKCSELPYVVSSRVSEYCKANNLPSPSSIKKVGKPDVNGCKSVGDLIEDAGQFKARLLRQEYRREDGVIQCPPVFAEGYGIDARSIC